MTLRATFYSIAIWLTLFGLIMRWGAAPMLRPPSPDLSKISIEQAASHFPVRVVPFPAQTTTANSPAAPEIRPLRFEYDVWAIQESHKRIQIGLIVWIFCGLTIFIVGKRLLPKHAKPQKFES